MQNVDSETFELNKGKKPVGNKGGKKGQKLR